MNDAVSLGVEDVEVCDACGAREHGMLLANVTDRHFTLPGNFAFRRCSRCGLVRLSPRPDQASLPFYYPPQEYGPYHTSDSGPSFRSAAAIRDHLRGAMLRTLGYDADSLPGWARLLPRRLPRSLVRRAAYAHEGFPRWVSEGKALDIGCGNGLFLDRIIRYGWQGVGIDFSPAAATAAYDAFGLTVHVGTVEDAPLEDHSFDFIHMSHVIEHLPKPVSTLRRVAALLRPGGRIYIETPNIDSIMFKLSRDYWYPLEAPRHLWLFSPSTLVNALAAVGLSVRSLRTRSWPRPKWEATYRYEQRTGERCSTRPLFTPRTMPRAVASGIISRAAPYLAPHSGDVLSCWAELQPTMDSS